MSTELVVSNPDSVVERYTLLVQRQTQLKELLESPVGLKIATIRYDSTTYALTDLSVETCVQLTMELIREVKDKNEARNLLGLPEAPVLVNGHSVEAILECLKQRVAQLTAKDQLRKIEAGLNKLNAAMDNTARKELLKAQALASTAELL